MKNYKKQAEVAQDFILSNLKDRMKKKKISQEKLAGILDVGVTTLWRYLNKKTPIPLNIYLEIQLALEMLPTNCLYDKKTYKVYDLMTLEKQLSTFKVAISDNHCTYNFELELPETTCIRDISKRLYSSFGLKEKQGTLKSEKLMN